MNQEWVVGLIVVAAAAYAVWYWLPAGARARLGRVNPALAQTPGCSACSSCSGCATPDPGTVAQPDQAQPIRVVRRAVSDK